MKATDLMIGDLVLYVDREGEIETPCKIHSLNQNREWSAQILNSEFIFQSDNNECSVEECLRPILLTSDILKKNGWVLDEIDGSYRNYDNHFWIGGRNAPWVIMISNICEEFNYVHELQHALKLCGIEKEIVL